MALEKEAHSSRSLGAPWSALLWAVFGAVLYAGLSPRVGLWLVPPAATGGAATRQDVWGANSAAGEHQAGAAAGLGEGQTNARPLIGILTVPVEADSSCVSRRRRQLRSDEPPPTSCVSALYVKWIESMGGRVVPIRYDLPLGEIDRLVDSVNGVLFSGGDVRIQDVAQEYMIAARHILGLVARANAQGTYLPLWGTCMGLQTLSVLVGGPAVLEYHIFQGVDPAMLPLELTESATDSRLFSAAPAQVLRWLATEKVTTNYHHDGVAPAAFSENQNLEAMFSVLATNHDQDGRPFASVIEGKSVPIWGVQFHPERPQFEFNEGADPVNHSREAVLSNAWLASFFVDQARRNLRKFPNSALEDASLVYNFRPEGSGARQTYFFRAPVLESSDAASRL